MKLSTLSTLLCTTLMGIQMAHAEEVQVTEKLDRGLFVATNSSNKIVQWRILPSDIANDYSFSLLRYPNLEDEVGVDTLHLTKNAPSYYLDQSGKYQRYKVSAMKDGVEVPEASSEIQKAEDLVRTIQLVQPAKSSRGATYTPNDASVGDVDGDGQYELIIKWYPSDAQDNGSSGTTSQTYFDCYEIVGPEAGKQLWRIDLGLNVRSGAHYSPFLVYDFDGDGKAEFVVKTAAGTKDAAGNYVSAASQESSITSTDNSKTYVNGNGHVTGGPEFLTIFSGETGQALKTIWYNPNRAMNVGSVGNYGSWESVIGKSTNYNRGERYNACVAYLDGVDKLPSIIMQRGYYTQAFFWAVDWDGNNLTTRWLHKGTNKSSWSVVDGTGKSIASGSGKSSFGQGVHSISVGDVDEDGNDEIVMGSATIDHDGKLLCSTGFGHGDAIHLGHFIPGRKGLQIYMPHEEKDANYGDDLHDAATGEVLYRGTTTSDNGRGMAGDVYYDLGTRTGLDNYYGWEFWSGAESQPLNATNFTAVGSKPSTNFRIYWNGDLFDDLFDGRYSSSTGGCSPRLSLSLGTSTTNIDMNSKFGGQWASCNTTKATPCLQADIWGDWREELILWNQNDPSQIGIFTTPEETKYPVTCLMTDHMYRMGIAWQNSSYNQPPHLGYHLPDAFMARYTLDDESAPLNDTITVDQEMSPIVIHTSHVDTINYTVGLYTNKDLQVNFDKEAQLLTISGTPNKTATLTDSYGITMIAAYNRCKVYPKLVIKQAETGIQQIDSDASDDAPCYDLQGRLIKNPQPKQIHIRQGRRFIN